MRRETEKVMELLRACPAYHPSPLRRCTELEEELVLSRVWCKDERERLGLGSFKALGGAYAVRRLVEEHGPGLGLCCASAGNHGLSVAAGARLFGARKALILLPETAPEAFRSRLREWGAEVRVAGETYDEAMECARKLAEEEGLALISDSSWTGYSETPRQIMEGYSIIGQELQEQFSELGEWPSDLFVQAGVGGLAAALASYVNEEWPISPRVWVVEPELAPCLGRSVAVGRSVTVEGEDSVMGRLDCKEPSLLALEVLKGTAHGFLEISDSQALLAAQALGTLNLATTASGAAGLAGVRTASQELGASSRVLFLVTESSL